MNTDFEQVDPTNINVNEPQILSDLNTNIMNTAPDKIETIEELEARLKALKDAQNAEKDRERKAYEDLRNGTITKLVSKAQRINRILTAFKGESFSDMQAIWHLLQTHSARHNDGKGNFRIEFGDSRITYRRQGKPTFDERSE
jgi:hypothetical protein